MVIRTLARHPAIVAHGEMFNPVRIGSKVTGHRPYSRAMLHLRCRFPGEFLDRHVFAPHADPVRAVGFKLFPEQIVGEGVWRWLDAHPEVAIVFLRRENHLARLVSLLIADKTGTFGIGSVSERPTLTIAIDPGQCGEEFRRMDAVDEETLRRLRGHQVLDLTYEGVVRDHSGAFARLHGFLGVEPQPVEMFGVKKEVRPLSEVIENFAELKTRFAGARWSGFFAEAGRQHAGTAS